MNQKLNLQHLPIETLIPYARNARTHTPSQVSQIVRSIEAFGFINPVLIDTEKTIIAGHARVLAAREIGLEHVPVIRVEHLTEDEKRAYILADNKLAENAGWNEDLLRVELEYLTQVDIDIDVDLTGFSVPEIDIHLGQADEKNFEEPLLFPPQTIQTM